MLRNSLGVVFVLLCCSCLCWSQTTYTLSETYTSTDCTGTLVNAVSSMNSSSSSCTAGCTGMYGFSIKTSCSNTPTAPPTGGFHSVSLFSDSACSVPDATGFGAFRAGCTTVDAIITTMSLKATCNGTHMSQQTCVGGCSALCGLTVSFPLGCTSVGGGKYQKVTCGSTSITYSVMLLLLIIGTILL